MKFGELLDCIKSAHVPNPGSGRVPIIRTDPFIQSTEKEIDDCIKEMASLAIMGPASPLQRLAIDLLMQSAGVNR